jgi:hypothetical protein
MISGSGRPAELAKFAVPSLKKGDTAMNRVLGLQRLNVPFTGAVAIISSGSSGSDCCKSK